MVEKETDKLSTVDSFPASDGIGLAASRVSAAVIVTSLDR